MQQTGIQPPNKTMYTQERTSHMPGKTKGTIRVHTVSRCYTDAERVIIDSKQPMHCIAE